MADERRWWQPIIRTDDTPAVTIASGARVELGDRESKRRLVTKPDEWVKAAWDYFDLIGELKYAHYFLANAASRVSLYPARIQSGAPPVRLDADDPATSAPIATLDALRSGAPDHSQMLRELTLQLGIPGDCYLIGIAPRPELNLTREVWEVRAKDELARDSSDNVTVVIRDGSEAGKRITLRAATPTLAGDFVGRIWFPHPHNAFRADSPTRGVLAACQELLLIDQSVRALWRSRMRRNKLLAIPRDYTVDPIDPTKDIAGQGEDTPTFAQQMVDAFAEPVRDESSAASVVPVTIYYPRTDGQQGSGIEVHDLEPKMDSLVKDRQEAAQQRLAQGLNLPVEIITGLGHANHWGGGQIEESTYRDHVEPIILTIVDALTRTYYQPRLRQAGVENWSEQVIWFDASNLIVHPNRPAAAHVGHARGTLSDEAWRRATGFTEGDKPTDDELNDIIERAHRLKGPAGPPPATEPDEPSPAPSSPPEPPGDPAPAEDASTPSDGPSAVSAAGTPLRALGANLAAIDENLTIRLIGILEMALNRTLERAGARARSLTRRSAGDLLRTVGNRNVVATLGRPLFNELGLDEDDILEGSLDASTVQRIERLARSSMKAAGTATDLDVTDEDMTGFDADLNDASIWLQDSFRELAQARLFDPDPNAPELGEHDEDATFPTDVVREFVARAGGNTDVVVAGLKDRLGSAKAWGIATGRRWRDKMSRAGMRTEGWVWVYGPAPRKTFEPHLNLDGLEVVSLSDDVLSNVSGWPDVSHYHPGDHAGCACHLEPFILDIR